MFENYKDSLFNDKIILRSQQRFRSDHHRVYTEKVNKISLSSNDDKRIQTHDKITTYSYETNIFKICENEMLLKNKFNDRLINEAQMPKNNSWIIRNNSQALRNNSQALSNEAQSLRNNSQVIKNKLHELRNEAHVIKNNSHVLRMESQALGNESKTLVNNSQVIKNEAQSLRNNSQVTRNEAHVPRDNDQIKDKDNITLDKINNKIDLINKIDKTLFEVNIQVTNKVKSIYEALEELQDETYNDPWLRLVELNKIEDILYDALNVVSKFMRFMEKID